MIENCISFIHQPFSLVLSNIVIVHIQPNAFVCFDALLALLDRFFFYKMPMTVRS